MNGLKYLSGRQKDWLINWIRLMEWQNHVLLGIFFMKIYTWHGKRIIGDFTLTYTRLCQNIK